MYKKLRAGGRKLFLQRRSLGHLAKRSGQPRPCQFDNLIVFQFLLFLFYFGIMRKFGDGPGILEEWVYNSPIF
jgi:hypothetical protein